jgi:hypothetical protein
MGEENARVFVAPLCAGAQMFVAIARFATAALTAR